MNALLFYQELQAIVLLLQVFEENTGWLTLWVLHIIDIKLGEVAGNNPARSLGVGQHGRVSLCLLEGSEECAIALLDGLSQILAQ